MFLPPWRPIFFNNLENFKQFALKVWRTSVEAADFLKAIADFYNGFEFILNKIKGRKI